MPEPMLVVEHLTQHFPVTRGILGRVVGHVRAVDDVSFHIDTGETVGLVGESGCGKTTVGRALLWLVKPSSGRVVFEGKELGRLGARELRLMRKNLQVVFQDPYGSLNPRMRVVDLVGEALRIHGVAQGEELVKRVVHLLSLVGVSESALYRYPHEFSGGQRQRIGVARALALNPKLVVCDEAVSALDVSIRAQVLNLLIGLRQKLGLSYLFISHDLSVVRHISDRVLVMYLGEIVESSPCEELFQRPAHPYTRALLSAIPSVDARRRGTRILLSGDVPSPLNPPGGCRFHTRCPAAMDRCAVQSPRSVALDAGHSVRCHHAEGLEGRAEWVPELERRIAENSKHNAQAPAEQEQARQLEPTPEVEGLGFGSVRLQGGVLAALGVLLALSGGGLFGAALLLGSWWLLRRRQAGLGRTGLLAALTLVALVIALGQLAKLEGERSEQRQETVRLRTEIDAYRRTTGEYPGQLADLGWRLFEVSEDPAGRSLSGYRYRRTPSGYSLEHLPTR